VQVTAGVPVKVSQATPTVSVKPVNINYGTALSNGQLDGTATWTVGGNPLTVTGTFTYTTAAGIVSSAGTGQSEAVTLTPSDSTDYTTAATTVTVNLAQAGSTTALSSSMNPTVYGQAVTFTASVASDLPLVGPPTGSVTFFAGATPLGSAPLSNGVASLAVTNLTVGSDAITAVYSGDPNFAGSPSAVLSPSLSPTGPPASPHRH
jgi:archaellum component FlaF (FlaF/FlaG flagellin family)